jgi:hypothetical protein
MLPKPGFRHGNASMPPAECSVSFPVKLTVRLIMASTGAGE